MAIVASNTLREHIALRCEFRGDGRKRRGETCIVTCIEFSSLRLRHSDRTTVLFNAMRAQFMCVRIIKCASEPLKGEREKEK